MKAIQKRNRSRLISAAMQKIPCDLTIENVKLFNVITGEIYPASIDILDGIIVRVREEGQDTSLPSSSIYDGNGRYLLPGLIDTHLHIESSMLIPSSFARAAVLCGTTTAVHDPHEIANVLGVEGVRFMLEDAKDAPVRLYSLVPSCVPSVVGAENAGASFLRPEIEELLDMDGVLGIAEVMDYNGVISDDPRMHEIVQAGLDRDCFIQGHSPALTDSKLAAYLLAGPVSCHEAVYPSEVTQKMRSGMHINLQSSSISRGKLPRQLAGIKQLKYWDNVSICSDDIHVNDILTIGHVNSVIRDAIASGISPMDAYRFATFNAARELGISDIGAIAPGYTADLQLLDEPDGRFPYAVFLGGVLAVEDGRLSKRFVSKKTDRSYPNTINMPSVNSPEDLLLKAPKGCGSTVKTAVLKRNGTLLSELQYEDLPVNNGYVDISSRPDLCFGCVINRHGGYEKTIAVYSGYNLTDGAVGCTISHDCHNLVMIYRDIENAYRAADKLRNIGGGIVVFRNCEETGLLPLPVAGLMNPMPAEEMSSKLDKIKADISDACGGQDGVLSSMTVMALACLHIVVITDLGIFDGPTGQFIPEFI